jgi:nitrite reductase (NADH) large subunit
MREKLVLVGNGTAGVHTLEKPLGLAPDRYDITMFGSDPCGNYNRGMLAPLLAGTVGECYDRSKNRQALYKCTGHDHDEVMATIRQHDLETMNAVREFMEWTHPDGCATCRPALNYHLLAWWPGEYRDDAQSRFINGRASGARPRTGTHH